MPLPASPAQAIECAICKAPYEDKAELYELPCDHVFHTICIGAWLERTSQCPLCRHQLPTDDEAFEEQQREEQRQRESAAMIERMHSTMFG
ncbi:uncharacterized protein MONBRDRAFT_15925 [Monosiga brevicollis MX1]|uniref:RING-type E3 ubiquitin transferase n=1 Tax=Monosiga brevicollis TaxID=81824 RepID=A9UVJ1_MONBE|nr:uncharacterized protein MONBRDRAFT_15925 [Monosiga brevicollis MX1]EDQ90408.1 predicted protein [Monosiga brevicollis MX1]|eukprot:XP_001744459.1 hypothetical protein [Monosiga brevicollis MX1]